jgi:hypothetical protein
MMKSANVQILNVKTKHTHTPTNARIEETRSIKTDEVITNVFAMVGNSPPTQKVFRLFLKHPIVIA